MANSWSGFSTDRMRLPSRPWSSGTGRWSLYLPAVVRDHQAAEDAFQATFLVLVCKARTIRGRGAMGGWLHRVAYRIAVGLSADAARLRNRERLVGDLVVQDQARDDSRDDWRAILHEEVARLSDRYRLPVLLCDLEGKTHAQAAVELKWGEATVRRRLAGGTKSCVPGSPAVESVCR